MGLESRGLIISGSFLHPGWNRSVSVSTDLQLTGSQCYILAAMGIVKIPKKTVFSVNIHFLLTLLTGLAEGSSEGFRGR